jgi:hypothetical protein
MRISLFHFLFLKTHFCPGILHDIVVIWDERGGGGIFFLPKYNILDDEMKTGNYKKGKRGKTGVSVLKTGSKPSVPLRA